SPLCNVTAYGLNYTMVGASVLGTNKYVLAMHYARTDYINSFNLSYSVPSGVVGTVIIIACSTAQYCNTISIPAGCVAKARENPLGRQSTSYAVIALCATPQPKTYYISGNLKGAYISLAIAAYNIP
ncbi:MAG: hypothetical protein KGH72_05010, partial [Candidatus Micrarchaeota archaeon]|nr:hypothetical protein [Candidatus Micrarchaeota archaeon]